VALALSRGRRFDRHMATYCERTVLPKSAFDKRSFRYATRGKVKVLVGCPKGQWSASTDRCRVGTRAHKVIAPAKGGKCKRPARRIEK